MITLEEQIRLVADAAASQAPAGHRRVSRAPASWLALAAATVLIVALVGALVWITRAPDTPSSPVPSPTNPVTVDYPVGTWLIPTWLPDGLEFAYALRGGDGLPNQIVYVGSDARVTVWVGSVPDPISTTDTVDIDGTVWQLDEQAGATESLTLYRSGPGDAVQIAAFGLTRADLFRFAGALREQPSTALPRPPLPVAAGAGVEVARTDPARGSAASLRVESDGSYLSLLIRTSDGTGGGGLPDRLDGRSLVISAVVGGTGGNFAAGIVRADVAVVEFGFGDGRTIRVTPQDLTGRFIERFVLVELPGADEGATAVTSVVAYDADGTELARQSQLLT
jgi:hypothetical protein